MKKPEWFELTDSEKKVSLKKSWAGILILFLGILLLAFGVYKTISPKEIFIPTNNQQINKTTPTPKFTIKPINPINKGDIEEDFEEEDD